MELNKELIDIIIIVSIAIGALSCFFGYRIFKVMLGILGFALGAFIAALIANNILVESQIVLLISAIVGGLIGAALMASLYFIGIFVLGAIIGGLIGTLISTALGGYLQIAAQLILAIIGGVMALIFQKFMIIIATSLSGSWSIVTGIYYFITGNLDIYRMFQQPKNLLNLDIHFYIILLCWLILGIISIFVQYTITGKKAKKKGP